jgi:hypothetical protein
MAEDTRPLLLQLSSMLEQMLAGADKIIEEPVYASIYAMAEELRETIVDIQAEVESHLEEMQYRSG